MLQKKGFQFIILLIIVVVFLYIVHSTNIDEIIRDLEKVDVRFIVLSMVMVFLSVTLSAYRWQIITREIKAEQSSELFNCLGFCSLGFLTGLVIPSRLGYYGKAPLLAKYDDIPLSKSISAVNIETIQDLYFLLLATFVSFFILFGYHGFSPILSTGALLVLIIAITFLLSFFVFYPSSLLKFCMKFQNTLVIMKDSNRIGRMVKNLFLKCTQMVADTWELILRRRFMGKLLVITTISQCITVIGFYCIVLSIGKIVSILYLFAILIISTLIGIISMIPGGLGSLDLTLLFFLQRGGLSLSESLNVAVLWRFCIILPILFMAGLFLLKTKISDSGDS